MSDEERKAVIAVTLFQAIRRREREIQALELEGKRDPQKERILSNLRQELYEEK